MVTPRATVEQYEGAQLHLLPPGLYWLRNEPETRLRRVLRGLAEGHVRLHDRALDLVDEADPRSTEDMLANWEETLGLPDPCLDEADWPATIADRQAAVHAELIATGGQDAAYYEEVADVLLGVPDGTCEVVDLQYLPFLCDIDECDVGKLWADGSQYIWTLKAPAATSASKRAQLECKINKLKPAHTQVVFEYTL